MNLTPGQVEFRDDALAYGRECGYPVWQALRILVEQNGDAEIRERYGIQQDDVLELERLMDRVQQAAAGKLHLTDEEWAAAGGSVDPHPTGPVDASGLAANGGQRP